jgi:hypothetical protein
MTMITLHKSKVPSGRHRFQHPHGAVTLRSGDPADLQ